jgi:predicted O-linked N-acetylglucosamine transferase (SPINDLY family)
MTHGAQLHAGGQPEQALIAFEQALALAPGDVNAASACATLLSQLSRPRAAYRTLLAVEPQLMNDADGAANLAIAAQACGDIAKAHSAYQRALSLQPQHLRSLTNLGLLAASQLQWELAMDCARQCLALQPGEAQRHVNLADALSGAERYAEALELLRPAATQFPGDAALRVRLFAVLALQGEFAPAQALLQPLDAAARAALRDFLARGQPAATRLPDAWQLYTRRAFEALAICDWRDEGKLTHTLREMLADTLRTGQPRDWDNTPLHGLMLALDEAEIARMRATSTRPPASTPALPAFVPRRTPARRSDERIRIGLVLPPLHDPLLAHALRRQLALHDATRFAFHLYAPVPPPEALQAQLAPLAAPVVPIAHVSDAEAAGRLRLDQLDLLMDATIHSPWARPGMLALRVAPVQLHPLTWQRHHAPGPCDYSVSDTFVHPDGLDLAPYGPVVRLPHTCWLASHDDQAGAGRLTRAEAGLPDDTLLLCALSPAASIDPQSFAAWMKILRSLPDAVLWLPACPPAAAAHLAREAEAAGVNSGRLLFAGAMTRTDALACLKHADLVLDTLRFNANQGLADALRLGVPALTCAGNGMASRLGGSLLRAAGLPEGILESQAAYVAEALRLGRDPGALQGLRQRLREARPHAPLFDLAARVREWEAAWSAMVERSRAGLPPAAFDVPPASEKRY